jgi:hypothetical protein
MSKKDFELIAATIKALVPAYAGPFGASTIDLTERRVLGDLTFALGRKFADEYPNFKPAVFIKACGF